MAPNYYQDRKSYVEGMQQSLQAFQLLMKTNPQEARRQALQSLIRSGIFKKDGTPKKHIVKSSVLV